MTIDHKTYSDLIRLIGYAMGVIDCISCQIEDERLKNNIINSYHSIDMSLEEIMEKAYETSSL